MRLILDSFATLVFDPSLWVVMLAAVALGMVYRAVPGLGGKLGIVLSIPLVFGMDTVHGCVFLIAMHSVVHTGGSIPSILLGIPGTGPDAATVCDGYPMALRGEGGRALGASLGASAVGGVLGAVFLAALIPVVGPIVLAFGPAEYFFLALLGLTFVGAVSGDDLRKGILVGALGLMLAFVGSEAQTGVQRFSFDQPFLWDGVDVITAVIGIFAVPECLALATGERADEQRLSPATRYSVSQLMEGVKDVGRHWGLTLRTSFIGAVIGLIPGLGGDVASWMCYGHAVQHSKTPERFGKGAVEGVIGPEAANNSKEGGALLPTLFFGIPGSSGMAVMLGAFVVIGVQPGPEMAGEHLNLVWVMIWTLVIANVLAAVMFLAIGRWLALVVHVRAGLLVPFVLLLGCVGSFLGGGTWENLFVLIVLGVLGVFMKRHHWPRAPFMIGLVLGPIMELSLHQSLTIWGLSFVLRPIALALAGATVATVVVSIRMASRRKGARVRRPELTVAVTLLVVFAGMTARASAYPAAARLMPLVIGIPAILLAAWELWSTWRAAGGTSTAGAGTRPGQTVALAWFAGFVLAIVTGGFIVGGIAAVVTAQRFWLRESWRTACLGGIAAFVVLAGGIERGLGQPLFEGVVTEWARGWLGI